MGVLVGFSPFYLMHPDNNVHSNPFITPSHISPEGYLLPYFAILRSFEVKVLGVVGMLGAFIIPLILPYIQSSLLINLSFRPLYLYNLFFLIAIYILLGYFASTTFLTLSLILSLSLFYSYISFSFISFIEFFLFFI